MKVGIFYGSTTGNTESVANKIAGLLSSHEVIIKSATDFSAEEVAKFDLLILGTSTWGFGELQDDWQQTADEISKADWSNKRVALFGLGDAPGWPDTFVDGMGLIYEKLHNTKAKITGFTPTEGYSFNTSKAIVDDHFIGLPLDENNQSSKTDSRLQSWVANLESN